MTKYNISFIRNEVYQSLIDELINDNVCIRDDIISKTFFWVASLYDEYKDGACRPYHYGKNAKARIEIVKKFAVFIDNIDCD